MFPESLSGRKFLYLLPPLNFDEFLYFKDKTDSPPKKDIEAVLREKDIVDYKQYETEYEEYLRFGGFPEVALTADVETKKAILKIFLFHFLRRI